MTERANGAIEQGLLSGRLLARGTKREHAGIPAALAAVA
jgi:hypothetical protein